MKTKVLIVEDEMLIALAHRLYLEREGFEVIGIRDNLKEIRMILAKQKPDIIMMDITLKNGQNGIEIANEIRETSTVPIVFATGNSRSDSLKKAYQITNSRVLIKPIDPQELKQVINDVLVRPGNS